jgi:RNA polymerase II subunit A small phosphatase-like protein
VGDYNDRELQWVMVFLDIAAEYEDVREAIRYDQALVTAS